MMFMQESSTRIVPGWGSKDAKICIIGEAPGAEEDRTLRPFSGAAGSVLDQCLHAAGMTRQDCYITNVVKTRPKGNKIDPFFNSKTGHFTLAGGEWVDKLRAELSEVRANVIVPLGAVALAAVTGVKSISKYRGYVMEASPSFGRRKVIPAYHPAAALRGQYILRYYITADLRKAKEQSLFPEIRRPKRMIVTATDFSTAREWLLTLLDGTGDRACDIEVMNFEVSAISFSINPMIACSISFEAGQWTESQEVELWRLLAKVLENSKIKKIFQNGIFDVAFLWTVCGIRVAGPIEDTMIAFSIMNPDMLKGLGFLVSLYGGAQGYYKDMVKFDNIKDES